MAHRLEHSFAVTAEHLWDAVAASLPAVTTQATWYETAHRVEWSDDSRGPSYGQVLTASVEERPRGTSVLRLDGASPYRPSLADRAERTKTFRTLVDKVTRHLAAPRRSPPRRRTTDEFRWWNGIDWTFEPPLSPPGWLPDPTGQHQSRYWDGRNWTGHVGDDGQVGFDSPAELRPTDPP